MGPRAIAAVPLTYGSIYTYKVSVSSVNAPISAWELTDFVNYVKRFDSEGQEQPIAAIKRGWMKYSIEVSATAPPQLVMHVWIVSPKMNKLQSVAAIPSMTAGEIGASVDAGTNNADPMLNWQDFRVHGYKKHLMGHSSTVVNATARERTQFGSMRWKPPTVVKNVVASQHWRQVVPSELKWTERVYLFTWVETVSGTPVTLDFTFSAGVSTTQTASRA